MQPPETGEPSTCRQSSTVLAATAGVGCTLLAGLIFLGHARAGETVDLFPCLMTATLTPLVVQTAGRLRAQLAVIVPMLFATFGVLLGKCLAWDLAGVVAGMSGDSAVEADWLTGLSDSWHALPVSAQRLNAALYLLTPIVAGAAIPTCCRLSLERPDSTCEPMTAETGNFRPRRWLVGLTCAWSIGAIAAHLAFSPPDRTGLLYFTLPFAPINQTNTMWGFAYMIDGSPVMSEEIPAREQVTWFGGAGRSDNNFRFLRAGYAWLGVMLFPWLSPARGLITLNIIAWLTCLACVWKLTARFYRDDVACCLATMLASTGIGFALHWNATTPHLVSFALYSLGLTALVESRITTQPRPWGVHLAWGTFLGLVSLVYNVWLMLALVYVVAGIRRQRWVHLAGSLLVAAAFAPMWRSVLYALGINVMDVEGSYLRRALAMWRDAAESGVLNFAQQVADALFEAVTSLESPVILLLGAVGLCCTVERGRRMFVLTAIAAPVLACALFSPTATARGYIVYGSSCLWFMGAGRALSLMLQSPRWPRWAGGLMACLVIASQLAWSFAMHAGYPGPALAYMYGWDDAAPLMVFREPEVVSLTGRDEVPVLYGGTGTPESTHSHREPASVPVTNRSRVLAYLSRLVFVLGVCLLLSALCDDRQRRTVCIVAALGLAVLLTEISWRMPVAQLGFWEIHRTLQLEPGESVTIRVEVPAHVQSSLREQLDRENAVGSLYVPVPADCNVSWSIDEEAMSLESVSRQEAECVDSSRVVASTEPVTWKITLKNFGNLTQAIAGWQSIDTPGKSITSATAICIPAIEFRIRDTATGRLMWLGF